MRSQKRWSSRQPASSSEHPAVQGFLKRLESLEATAGAALDRLNRDLEDCLREIAEARIKR